MPKLPVLSGRELIEVLARVGFTPARQKGSQIVLTKIDENGKHAVVVPDHREIDKGTLANVIRQAGISRSEFLKLVR